MLMNMSRTIATIKGRIHWAILACGLSAFFVRVFILYAFEPFDGVQFNYWYETYSDFAGYYIHWLHSLATGALPYRDFFYQYPPLFLYILLPFYLLGGAQGAAWPIALADSGTALLTYLIANQISSRRVSVLAGFGYALSPLAILYEGYTLLSLQPMLFFLLLSIYLLRNNKLNSSVVAFAIAVLFKQEAIFILPAYAIYMSRFRFKEVATASVVFASILLLASAPFLQASPVQYVSTLLYRPIGYPSPLNSSSLASTTTTCYYSVNLATLVQTCFMNGTATMLTRSIPLGNQLLVITNVIFEWALLPIALLVLPALYVSRKRPAFLVLTSAYSFSMFVLVFAYLVGHVPLEAVARYPYLPAYALLLISGTSWRIPVVATAFAGLSLLLPPGVIQMTLPFFALLAVMAVEDRETRLAGNLSGSSTKSSLS
jgi:4-amino-4-deoxy-L-arabinose transferase-like glycosyltransferase